MTTTPTPTTEAPALSFTELGLAEPLLRALETAGYTTPTPVQAIAIPLALSGRDLLASAQTGTGKTAAFVLPTLQRLAETEGSRGVTRALILTPTRELAEQVELAVRTYGGHLRLRTAILVGGMPYGPQMGALRRGADLVVATPGRLLDHLDRGELLRLDTVETFVLDEADRMLDMGFQPDLARLAEVLPAARQTLMFSATIPREVEKLAHSMLRNPERIEIGERRSPATTVVQRVVTVAEGDKMRLLLHLLRTGEGLAAGAEPRALVFTKTKIRADELSEFLMGDGVPVGVLHGDRSQIQRRRALDNFRSGRVAVLVATDVAARGIDIRGLDLVVNFDAPMAPEDYIHRIGRTGRAEATGEAISFVSNGESWALRNIERHIGRSLERQHVEGYSAPEPAPRPARAHAGGPRRGGFQGGGSGGSRPNGSFSGGAPRREEGRRNWK